jgi:hypothetical protein
MPLVHAALVPLSRRWRRRFMSTAPVALALVACACARKMTDDEARWWGRASSIRIGDTATTVRGKLGPPTSIASSPGVCRQDQGAAWIYDAIDQGSGTLALSSRFVLCVGDARVTMVMDIVHH